MVPYVKKNILYTIRNGWILIRIGILLFIISYSGMDATAQVGDAPYEIAPIYAPFEMQQPERPHFPGQEKTMMVNASDIDIDFFLDERRYLTIATAFKL